MSAFSKTKFLRAHRKLKNVTEDGTEDGNLKSPIMQNSATQTQDSSLQINEGVDPNQTQGLNSIYQVLFFTPGLSGF